MPEPMFDIVDPFEDVDWVGWARFGRGPGCKWHRVIEAPRTHSGERSGFVPLCRCRHDPMPPSTEVFDYRWDPGSLDRCLRCWPPGVPHPGILSDLPPERRYR